MHMQQIFESFRRFTQTIQEGGGKAPSLTGQTSLTPNVANEAMQEYQRFISQWGAWLDGKFTEPPTMTSEEFLAQERSIDLPAIQYVGPVGSVSYTQQDIEQGSDVIYGDIDVLVEIPMPSWIQLEDPTQERLVKLALRRAYKRQLIDYIEETQPPNIHADATLSRNDFSEGQKEPFMIILRLEDGSYVQADSIVTYSDISSWTKERFTPMRGFKGYVHGNFYDVLSDMLNVSMNRSGVVAKFQGGKIVPSRMRKDVQVKKVSSNPRTFFVDILQVFAGSQAESNPLLDANPGLNPETHETDLLKTLASGAKGLFIALQDNGVIDDAEQKISSLLELYREKNIREAERRESKDPSAAGKFFEMSDAATRIVSDVLVS